MTLRGTAILLGLALMGSASLFAQTVTGSLVGIVVDPAGAVVPGVSVTLTNQGTNAKSVAASDNSGLFRFPNLNPATYSLNIQAKGFKTRIITDVVVGLSDNRDLGRLTLDIGNVTETITVSAS